MQFFVSLDCLLFKDEIDDLHPDFEKADRLTRADTGAAFEVQRIVGPEALDQVRVSAWLNWRNIERGKRNDTNMIDPRNDDRFTSVARAVARGRSAASWAKLHNTPLAVADEWRTLPEFTKLVEDHRLQAADQMTGKLTTQSTVAIDDLFDAFTRSPSYAAKLTSGRMLVDNWLRISLRFEATRKLAEVKARVTILEQNHRKSAGASPRA